MLRFFSIAIAIFFSSVLTSNGQLLIGPKVGVQLSYTSFEDKTNLEKVEVKPLLGWNAGAAIAVEMKKRYYLHFEIIYSLKGKITEGILDERFRNQSFNHHIDVPIFFKTDFKARVGKKNIYRWYGGVGPNISYWLRGNGFIESSDIDEDFLNTKIKYNVVFGDQPTDLGSPNSFYVPRANRLQLGLNFGTGLVFEPFNGQRLIIDFRYELGHTFLAQDAGFFGGGIATTEDLKSRNSGFRVSTAYLFNTKIEQRRKGKSTVNKNKNKKKKRLKKKGRRR